MNWRALTDAEARVIAAACIQFDPYLTLGYRADTLFNYLTRPDPALDRYAIEIKGMLVGVLCLRRPWLRGPLIEMLALLPEAQGQGVGSRIMERCKRDAGRNLWSTVSAFHAPALRFYRHHGFLEMCALPDLILDQQEEILLRWKQTC